LPPHPESPHVSQTRLRKVPQHAKRPYRLSHPSSVTPTTHICAPVAPLATRSVILASPPSWTHRGHQPRCRPRWAAGVGDARRGNTAGSRARSGPAGRRRAPPCSCAPDPRWLPLLTSLRPFSCAPAPPPPLPQPPPHTHTHIRSALLAGRRRHGKTGARQSRVNWSCAHARPQPRAWGRPPGAPLGG
jgi:hypothetical protein